MMLILIVIVMINYGVDDDRHRVRDMAPPLILVLSPLAPNVTTGQQCDTNNGSEKYNSFSFTAQFNGHIDIHCAVALENTIPL